MFAKKPRKKYFLGISLTETTNRISNPSWNSAAKKERYALLNYHDMMGHPEWKTAMECLEAIWDSDSLSDKSHVVQVFKQKLAAMAQKIERNQHIPVNRAYDAFCTMLYELVNKKVLEGDDNEARYYDWVRIKFVDDANQGKKLEEMVDKIIIHVSYMDEQGHEVLFEQYFCKVSTVGHLFKDVLPPKIGSSHVYWEQ